MDELYKIIEDNFRIDDTNKIKLLGAMQELRDYRENPIANMQPCWEYVRKNGIEQQLDHIGKEITEVRYAQGLENLALECFDVLQTAITLMFILMIKFNVDIAKTIKQGTLKNEVRGYYKKKGLCNRGF